MRYSKIEMTAYTLIRSKRKSVSVSVSRELEVIVRAPLKMPKRDIDAFVAKNADWIINQTEVMQERKANRIVLSDEQITALISKAKTVIPAKVRHFADIMDVSPTGIRITSAVARWGSCSGKNSLCFSFRLMLLPEDLIDYVVVHELAHIKEKNHKAGFYAVLAEYVHDHKEKRKRLKEWSKSH